MATFDDMGADRMDTNPEPQQDPAELALKKQKALRDALKNQANPQQAPTLPTANTAPSASTLQSRLREPTTGIYDTGNVNPQDTANMPSYDQVLDRKTVDDFVKRFATGSKPFDADKLEQKRKEIFDQLAPDSPKMQAALQPYEDQLDDYTQQMKDLQGQKMDMINKSQWAQAAESFGNALAQYAGGLYGMKHGVDTSGMKFSNVDWQGRLKNQMDALGGQLDVLKEGRGLALQERGQEQARQLRGGEEAYQGAVLGEKEDVERSQQMAKARLQAAMELGRAELTGYTNMTYRAQRMAATGDRAGLREVDQNYKEMGGKLQGLNDAISTLKGIDSGSLKDDDRNQTRLNQALAKAGLDAASLQDKMQRTGFLSMFRGPDTQAGVQYLTALQAKAQDAYGQMDKAHSDLFQKVTGMQRPDAMKLQLGGTQQPATPAAPTGGQPAGNSLEGAVRVRNKMTGQVGTIPYANLDAALKSGQFEEAK